MSNAFGIAAAAAVVGFAAGALLRDAIAGLFVSIRRRREQRATQSSEMRKVVMTVDPDWTAYSDDIEWANLVGMTVNVTLENHSEQLIRNVRVAMHRRPVGVDSGKMLPALPAGQGASIEVRRELGLDPDDRPFDEEKPGWLDLYWFEARFEDTRNRAWRLYHNPRDEIQTVEPDSG